METNSALVENLPQVGKSSELAITEELFEKGIKKYQLNDISGAIEIYETIVGTNPELTAAHSNLGNAYFKAKRIDDALNCWKKSLSIDPMQITCYINIGNVYYLNKKFTEAIFQWQVALAICPTNLKALKNIGAAYEKLENKDYSFLYYEKYLKLASANKNKDYSIILNKVNKSKKIALKCLKKAIKIQQNGQFDAATAYYLKSISIYPNYAKSNLNLGSIYYLQKNYEKTINFWLKAIKLDPSVKNTYCNIAISFEKLKKYTAAHCMYTRFLNNSDTNSKENEIAKLRLDKIKTYFKQEDIENHLKNGDKFFANQRYYEAMIEYENYLILKPDKKSIVEAKIKQSKEILARCN